MSDSAGLPVPYLGIGQAGSPWGDAEKKAWFNLQQVQRSYESEVVEKINVLASYPHIEIAIYGQLDYRFLGSKVFDLYAIRSKNWQPDRPTVLVTGGVHGYETSGVQGALLAAEELLPVYSEHWNILILPCISPWGYETINRWNPLAIDPNRSFYANTPAQEAALAMAYVKAHAGQVWVHIDLHETTDTDNSEFRPALASRDAKPQHSWNIPDGFYTVAHTEKVELGFQQAVLKEVAQVTHIAEADEAHSLIGSPVIVPGLIGYSATELGLCMGFTDAAYVTTTEVYPDSERTDPQTCIKAQVAAIQGGLAYLLNR